MQLAIIIPAYKDTYLRSALDSIAAQTCKDFTLYIGDDCSPYNIGSIVDEFKDKIDLVYKRFDINLGGRDLVAQWERCIDMSQDEPYIWLFSDDDVMEPRCVEEFLNLSKEIRDNYLIHFNIGVIDEFKEGLQSLNRSYPQKLTAKDYLDEKLHLSGRKGLNSYVVEFVFARFLYNKCNKFQNYDLAWGADFITWLKFSGECSGIYTIASEGTHVLWRRSSQNISPDKSKPIMMRKLYAIIDYTSFIKQWLNDHGYKYSFKYSKYIWGEMKRNISILDNKDIKNLTQAYYSKIGFELPAFFSQLFLKLIKPLKK